MRLNGMRPNEQRLKGQRLYGQRLKGTRLIGMRLNGMTPVGGAHATCCAEVIALTEKDAELSLHGKEENYWENKNRR